jgi:hypothetical protein
MACNPGFESDESYGGQLQYFAIVMAPRTFCISFQTVLLGGPDEYYLKELRINNKEVNMYLQGGRT